MSESGVNFGVCIDVEGTDRGTITATLTTVDITATAGDGTGPVPSLINVYHSLPLLRLQGNINRYNNKTNSRTDML